MPLIPGKSKSAFEQNIRTEMAAGKPQRQALAISYSEAGESKNKKPKKKQKSMLDRMRESQAC